jgi:hypothetical protein
MNLSKSCATVLLSFGIICCALAAPADEHKVKVGRASDGFIPLFNGKNLDGWHGDKKLWKVADGVIVGSTDGNPLKNHSFLISDHSYKNFILRVKYKLRNFDSGIQFRSKEEPNFYVSGYQANISNTGFIGILYEDKGRAFLTRGNVEEDKKYIKPTDWNQYVVTADGPHIKHEINGHTFVNYVEKSDKGATEGIIAFQLHLGDDTMKVEFKDIEIKQLP